MIKEKHRNFGGEEYNWTKEIIRGIQQWFDEAEERITNSKTKIIWNYPVRKTKRKKWKKALEKYVTLWQKSIYLSWES